MSCTQALAIPLGHTFEFVFRIGTAVPVLRAIEAISKTAPVTLTVPNHGLTRDWPFRIEQLQAPTELNSPEDDPGDCYLADVVDPRTLRLAGVNGLGLKAFAGAAAVIRYYKPDDLTGLAARLLVRKLAGGEVLATYSSTEGGVRVEIDTASIVLALSALQTKAITWRQGVYDLELFDPLDAGRVYQIASGSITASL